MYEISCDVAIIGGGPAGLAAAVAAKREGAGRVLIIERDSALGGILQQCIHPGFGLAYYNEELTGPEYAGRFIAQAKELGVETLLDSMVLEVDNDASVTCVNSEYGVTTVKAKATVLTMGCRERTRGAIQIPGSRPAGVYTAGAAQRLINRQNQMVGRTVVILGSGDIGMIMARRMTLEGAKVPAVVEIMDYLAGLTRNRVQCLDDFGIPLFLSHTITKIVGNERLEGVWVAQVDADKKPIKETEKYYPCDTLLLSVGLIPENELTRAAGIEINPVTNGPSVNQRMQTSAPAIFAAGNVVHVNDLVDNVSVESETAGREAARFAKSGQAESRGVVTTRPGNNVRYISPQRIDLPKEDVEVDLYFRVSQPDLNVAITASAGGKELAKKSAVKVNPGEMEHMRVKSGELSAGELIIDVKPKTKG